MKKCFFLSVLVLVALIAQAQSSRFGIFGGPQYSSALYKISGVKQETTGRPGFHLGAGWKIPFENRLYFAPSAFYSMKGYEVDFNRPAFPPDSQAIDNTTRLHTLELAFLLQVDFGKKDNHLFLKAGPSLDFQLAGSEKFNRKTGGEVDRNMKFSFGDYGRYAASMILQFGWESKSGTFVSANYTHGLGSINNADGGPRIVHRVYGLSVGKYFKGKSKK